MAIGVEATSNSGGLTAQSTVTVPHTVTAATVLIMTSGVGESGSFRNVFSATYDGIDLTLVDSQYDGTFESAEIWKLTANIHTGTHDLVVKFGDGTATVNQVAIGISGITGASTTLGSPSKTTNTTANPSLTVVDSASGDLVIAVLASDNSSGATTEANTLLWEAENVGSDTDINAQSTIASGASTVMAWTESNADGGGWSAVGVAVRPASGGGPGTGADSLTVGESDVVRPVSVTLSIAESG